MSKNKRRLELLPPWNMPSDPVKALWWFLHWLLKVLVRYFWLPILLMALFEAYINWSVYGPVDGIISLVVTILVGVVVWVVLWAALLFVNISTNVSQVISDINQFQQNPLFRSPASPFAGDEAEPEGKIIEGTITDLEEERNKRRRE